MCENKTSATILYNAFAILLFGQLRTGTGIWNHNQNVFKSINATIVSSLWKSQDCECFMKSMKPTLSQWYSSHNLSNSFINPKVHGHVLEMYYTIKFGIHMLIPHHHTYIIFSRTDLHLEQFNYVDIGNNVITFGEKGYEFKEQFCGPNPIDYFFYTTPQVAFHISNIYDDIRNIYNDIYSHMNFLEWTKLGRKKVTENIVLNNPEGFLSMQLSRHNISCKVVKSKFKIMKSQNSVWYKQNIKYKLC